MIEGIEALGPLPARVALVGVAKNCGKTTTLNALLGLLRARGQRVGLASIGVDGERADALLATHKPAIRLDAGQWVISAEGALAEGDARLEYVAALGWTTPLGEVVLARVVEPGTVVLAGVRQRAELLRALDALSSVGQVDVSLVDGAYGRRMAAHAALTDGVIVATGAIVSASVAEIVATTQDLTDRLTLPALDAGLGWHETLVAAALAADRALLGGPTLAPEGVALPAASALLGLPLASALWTDAVQAIAIPGLVSDRVVEALLAVPAPASGARRALLLDDGTALHCSPRHLARLRRGWEVRARHPARLLAIAYNPTSIVGPPVEDAALRDALVRVYPDLPVFNPASWLL